MLRPELLEIVACPACLGELLPVHGAKPQRLEELVCQACAKRYPVVSGIPDLSSATSRYSSS